MMGRALAAGALVGAGFWLGLLVTANGYDLADKARRAWRRARA